MTTLKARYNSLPYKKVSLDNKLNFSERPSDALISQLTRYNVPDADLIVNSLWNFVNYKSLFDFYQLLYSITEERIYRLVFLVGMSWISEDASLTTSMIQETKTCNETLEELEFLSKIGQVAENRGSVESVMEEELYLLDSEIPDYRAWLDDPFKILQYIIRNDFDISPAIEELYAGEIYRFLEDIIFITTGFDIRSSPQERDNLKAITNTAFHILIPGGDL
jgi:hypothetical protein